MGQHKGQVGTIGTDGGLGGVQVRGGQVSEMELGDRRDRLGEGGDS